MFFVGVPADAVEPDAQEQGDGQHRQPGVAAELDVVVEHPWPEGHCAGSRLELDMDQRHQVGHVRAGRWRPGPQFQPGHEVELPLFALRRCQKELLVEPVDLGELEPLRPGREEAKEKGLEEFLE
jgi:hypothetical protein